MGGVGAGVGNIILVGGLALGLLIWRIYVIKQRLLRLRMAIELEHMSYIVFTLCRQFALRHVQPCHKACAQSTSLKN